MRHQKRHRLGALGIWSRGPDSNRRPSGYEPDELTRLLHPAICNALNARSNTTHLIEYLQALSLIRLFLHISFISIISIRRIPKHHGSNRSRFFACTIIAIHNRTRTEGTPWHSLTDTYTSTLKRSPRRQGKAYPISTPSPKPVVVR